MLTARKLNDRTLIIQDSKDFKLYFELTKDLFKHAEITSTFRNLYELPDDHTQADEADYSDWLAANDVLESMLLSMYAEGVDLTTKPMLNAIQTTLDAIQNNIT